jgi:hypothetical protein
MSTKKENDLGLYGYSTTTETNQTAAFRRIIQRMRKT